MFLPSLPFMGDGCISEGITLVLRGMVFFSFFPAKMAKFMENSTMKATKFAVFRSYTQKMRERMTINLEICN